MSSLNEKTVSIVIPTYNRPLLVRRAVASVLAQSVENLEVIVVDDSSDQNQNVQEIVMSLRDHRIRYERHRVSMGPSAARNTGIEKSKGEYIAFLDDDDIWMEKKLEQQLNNINKHNASLCGFFTQHGVNVKNAYSELGFKELRYERDFAINSGLLVNRKVIDNIRFDDELRVGEDIDFVFKLLKKGNIAYLNKPYYFVDLGCHKRITTEKRGDPGALEKRLLFVQKNMDTYGQFWGNYTVASILLREFKFEYNKINKIIQIFKRCGISAASFAIYRKIIVNIK